LTAAVASSTGGAGSAAQATAAMSTLEWLEQFNMDGQTLQQLVNLRPRIMAATESGIFSGGHPSCSAPCTVVGPLMISFGNFQTSTNDITMRACVAVTWPRGAPPFSKQVLVYVEQ
jgi:hypothetical protein